MATTLTIAVPHSVPGIEDGPGTKGLAEQDMAAALKVVQDVYTGTLRLRGEGETYLPQFPKEEDAAYDRRLQGAVLYNAFKRTVKGLTGMVFRKPPTLSDDVPVEIAGTETEGGLIENIDLRGRHLNVFMRDQFLSKTRDGHVCILVDWKGDSAEFGSKADETAAGARPYWVLIRKGQILRHESMNLDGEIILVQFAYMELDIERFGDFGQKYVLRVKQYDLLQAGEEVQTGEREVVEEAVVSEGGNIVSPRSTRTEPVMTALTAPRVLYRSWVKDLGAGTEAKGWADEDTKLLGPRMTRIPIVTDYADPASEFMVSQPPLLDLALENIRHYQLRSERDASMHVSLVDILVILGLDPSKLQTITVGPAIGIILPGAPEEMDVKYVGAPGHGLQTAKEELGDIEQRMATYGLSMLVRQVRAAETAEAKRIDKSENDSELAASANGTSDAGSEALGLTAQWLGKGEDEGGSLEVNTDFGIEPLDPAMVTALSAMVDKRQLTIDTMWDMLEKAEMLPEHFDRDTERAELEAQEEKDVKQAAEMFKATSPPMDQPPPGKEA